MSPKHPRRLLPRPPHRRRKTAPAQAAVRPRGLRFGPSGTFTIVQFTDLHWCNGEEPDQSTRALMEAVLDAERPELVALTGDVVSGEAALDPAHAYRSVIAPIEARGIPWAAVFGNHDDEGTLS